MRNIGSINSLTQHKEMKIKLFNSKNTDDTGAERTHAVKSESPTSDAVNIWSSRPSNVFGSEDK